MYFDLFCECCEGVNEIDLRDLIERQPLTMTCQHCGYSILIELFQIRRLALLYS